jgi:hydroxymethylbilane synthase
LKNTVRLGTRGSALALRQAALAAEELRRIQTGVRVETIEVKTAGDRDQASPLSSLGGRGVFTAELEQALVRRVVDVAVHSLKDLPTDETEGLTLAAILERGDVRDAVISRDAMFLHELAPGSRVGTSSTRRKAQVRNRFPGLVPVEIRGNVDTRIRKLRAGEYDAIILAAAGLQRLGRIDEAAEVLEPEEMLPAPGQGALALQCRADDLETLNIVRAADHGPTRAAVTAERTVLAILEGGCAVPVAAYGRVEGHRLSLSALVASPDGETILEEATAGMAADPGTLGTQLAGVLLERGAARLIAQAVETAGAFGRVGK